MEYKYIMYNPTRECVSSINERDFNKLLFNETILNVVHKQLNMCNDVLIYEMLSYNVYDDTTNIFYLIVKRAIKE